jgi:hypothetical protein
MENSRLHIRRFHAEYLVSGDHLAPQLVKGRIDEAVAQHLLGPTLSTILSRRFSETDESVWLIRRLELDVAVNASWEKEELTRVIAMQLARTLGSTLEQEENDENVLRFASRAAYLAHFLSDLAAGTAWGRWYYESFAGLRPLSTSAALRSAICDQQETGESALRQLTNEELKKVTGALASQDARRVLDSFAGHATEAPEFECCQAAWAALRMIEADSFNRAHEWSQALHLYLLASRERPDVGGATLKQSATAVLQLARLTASSSAEQVRQILGALTGGDLRALYQAAGGADAEMLAPLLLCPPVWVREVIETLLARSGGGEGKETEGATARRATSFGGIFLLLPLIDELPLAEATRGWPQTDEAAAISLVRFLLLVKCCGQQQAQSAFYDPLLRDLSLIPPGVSPLVIREWGARIKASQLRRFLETLIDWQSSRGAIQNKRQILGCADLRGVPVAILIDGARGHWLTCQSYSRLRPQRLVKALRSFLSRLDGDDGILLCESSLLATFWSELTDVRMLGLEDERARDDSGEERQLAGLLSRLDKLPADLEFLSLPHSLRLARSLDQTLSVAAQQVYRAFSWRLPGFAEASVPYLSSNFLAFSGSVEEEPARRVVRLSRPPLHLVLSLTGIARQTYCLSWLDERALALFPEI